jgi:hypothetical protein
VANARRALVGAAPLGRIHASLYGPLAAGSNFNDVIEGSNGSPVWARAGARYDIPTGMGGVHGDILVMDGDRFVGLRFAVE